MNIVKKILGDFYDVPIIRFLFELFIVILPIAFIVRTFGFGLYQVPSGSMETTLLVGERFFADKVSYWFRKPRRNEIIAFNDPTYDYSKNPLVKLWQNYASWHVTNWTKRLIAIPGDHIKGVIEDGKPVVYLNGKKLDEPYVNKYPLVQLWKQSIRGCPIQEGPIESRSFDPNLGWQEQIFYRINPSKLVLLPNGNPVVIWPQTPDRSNRDIFELTLGPNEYWAMGDNRLGSMDSRMWRILKGDLIHGKIVFRIWSIDSDEAWWIVDLIKHPIDFWSRVRWSRCLQFVG